MKKTIVELDLKGYTEIVTLLEQHLSPEIIGKLNEQIQSFVDSGLGGVSITRNDAVKKSDGDNAMLYFDRAEDAHNFGKGVHDACQIHNRGKTIATAHRWFRIGIATGDVPKEGISCDAVIRAYRLEAAAKTGEILIDEATFLDLPPRTQACYGSREVVFGKRDQRFEAYRCVVLTIPGAKRRTIPYTICIVGALAALAIFLSKLPPEPFPPDVAGILVLRLAGDDKDSLQSDLVSSLNSQLAKETTAQKIEVRGAGDYVDEKQGLEEAHKKAREIGRMRKALLVIWGTRVGDTRFFPRITIVRETNNMSFTGERTLMVQNIREFSLPPETVALPIYLAHFIAGYSFYDKERHGEALNCFEEAVHSTQATPEERADLQFLIGDCHLHLAQTQKSMLRDLNAAIDNFILATNYFGKANNLERLANAQGNLSLAYYAFPIGNRDENLKLALASCQESLRVFTEMDFPYEWAVSQNHLGNVYSELVSGNHAENLKKSFAAYQAALQVFTEKDFPLGWASTQINLGMGYAGLTTGNRTENLRRSIAACQAALRVITEKDWFPDVCNG